MEPLHSSPPPRAGCCVRAVARQYQWRRHASLMPRRASVSVLLSRNDLRCSSQRNRARQGRSSALRAGRFFNLRPGFQSHGVASVPLAGALDGVQCVRRAAQPLEIELHLRQLRIHLFQCAPRRFPTRPQVSVPLAVGRNDVPGRMLRAASCERVFEYALIAPQRVRSGEVGIAELPAFERLVQPREQPSRAAPFG